MKTIKKIELKVSRLKISDNKVFYNKKVYNSADVAKVANAILAYEDQEVCIVFHLSSQNEIIAYSEVSRGAVDFSIISPSIVFRPAIVNGATSIIFVHNHPSGSVDPSNADDLMTNRIKKAGELLGIALLDHIIVPSVLSNDGYYSYLDKCRL